VVNDLFDWLVYGEVPKDQKAAHMYSDFVKRVKALEDAPLKRPDC
jgi:hypothetical protein